MADQYGIWLSWNNQQEGFQIPINPGSIEMGDGSNSTTYEVVGLGEINVIKSPRLTTFSFSSIFPAKLYPFISASIVLKPYEYVDMIKRWMETKRPIRFVFTGASFDINEAVSIERFDWKEGCRGRRGHRIHPGAEKIRVLLCTARDGHHHADRKHHDSSLGEGQQTAAG